jgi:nitrogen fixation protein
MLQLLAAPAAQAAMPGTPVHLAQVWQLPLQELPAVAVMPQARFMQAVSLVITPVPPRLLL